MKTIRRLFFMTLMIICVFIGTTYAADVEIDSAEDLNNIRNNLSGSYILTTDIDLSETVWGYVYADDLPDSQGWDPIGTSSNQFTGSFNGNGYTISGLYINRPSMDYVGLFGYTNGAEISKINLEYAIIGGRNYTGTLVGRHYGEISNVSVIRGNILGTSFVGGLVGENNGVISNSYATGTLTGLSESVGGLVGRNFNKISTSYAAVDVDSLSHYVGGLVGYNDTGSYKDSILNSYATGNVNGGSWTGGLVGLNYSGTINYTYATGSVTAGSIVGGLVARNNNTVGNTGIVGNSYYNSCTTGQTDTGKGDRKTTTEMVQENTFSSWDFSNTWSINEGESYPYLQWSDQAHVPPATTGISISSSDLEFNYGDSSSAKLTATVEPNCAVQSVAWASSDSEVVIVDENGWVTPIGAGEATITVTTIDGKFSKQVNVMINKKVLTIDGSGTFIPENKEYDGTTRANIIENNLILVGVIDGDDVTLNPVAEFAHANMGEGINVNLTSESYLTGQDADNYLLSLIDSPSTTADISRKQLTVITEGKRKTYGDSDPQFSVICEGFVEGEDISILGGELAINRELGENVGTYIVTPSGLTSDNYEITFELGTLIINPKELTIGGSFIAQNKEYDETTSVTITENNLTLVGLIDGDDVTLNPIAEFAYADVGEGLTVNLNSESSLTGEDADNYILSLADAPSATGDITAHTNTEDSSSGSSSGGGSNNDSGDSTSESEDSQPAIDGDKAEITKIVQIESKEGADGSKSVQVSVMTKEIEVALEADKNIKEVVVQIDDKSAEEKIVSMPVEAYTKMAEKRASLVINTERTTLNIPALAIDTTKLTEEFGDDGEKIEIHLSIKEVVEEDSTELNTSLLSQALKPISKVLQFNLEARSGNKTVPITSFGNHQVRGEINLTKEELDNVDNIRNLNVYRFNSQAKQWEYVTTTLNNDGSKLYFYTNSFSDYAVMESKKAFEDIEGHWAQEDLNLLVGKGIINGYKNNLFEPENKITRAEFTSILVKLLNIPLDKPKASSFDDVEVGEWYYSMVEAATKTGIINGYGDGRFGPNDEITREQVAVLLMKALEVLGQSEDTIQGDGISLKNTYSDMDKVSIWAKEYLNKAIQLGIINGFSDSTIAPNDNASRAQAGAMIVRLMDVAGLIEEMD